MHRLQRLNRKWNWQAIDLCHQSMLINTVYIPCIIKYIMDQEISTIPLTNVLLVCVYNKSGAIITHDLLYEIFSPYGLVQRILIFVKAKVWKAFVELDSVEHSQHAIDSLDNTVILQDGSKMLLFPSKMKEINFQNGNNGGVDYQMLRKIEEMRRLSPGIESESYQNPDLQHYYSWPEIDYYTPMCVNTDSNSTIQSQHKMNSLSESIEETVEEDSWFSPPKTRKRQGTWAWYDIDAQFQELALQSEQYRNMRSRPKSKTVVIPYNPKKEEYILDNYPSKVLFIRSIPNYHTISSIYNIMGSYGNITKIVHMPTKESMLVQYQHIQDAIQAKDFLNQVKNGIKAFFSHYESLLDRDLNEDQRQKSYSLSYPKKEHFNPITETLHVSYLNQNNEQQFKEECEKYGKVKQFRWITSSTNNKKMLLMKMESIEEAMKVVGFLQGFRMGNKYARISFTRSKINQTNHLSN